MNRKYSAVKIDSILQSHTVDDINDVGQAVDNFDKIAPVDCGQEFGLFLLKQSGHLRDFCLIKNQTGRLSNRHTITFVKLAYELGR